MRVIDAWEQIEIKKIRIGMPKTHRIVITYQFELGVNARMIVCKSQTELLDLI